MSKSPLEAELKEFGYKGDPEEFRALLVRTLIAEYPGYSDDNLIDNPTDSNDYCGTIQDTTGNWDIPDDLILRTLANTRKRVGLPKGTVVRSPSPPLAKELTKFGCGCQEEEFEAALVQEFRLYAEAFSTETIRYRPRVARRYCEKVRILLRCADLPDEMILRRLGGIRKAARLPALMGD